MDDASSKKNIERYINETHKHVKNYEIQKEFLLLSNYFKDKNNQESLFELNLEMVFTAKNL